MPTTVEECLARAEERRFLNGGASLRPDDTALIVWHASLAQREVATVLAARARAYLLVRQNAGSSSAASGRTLDVETLPVKLQRVLAVGRTQPERTFSLVQAEAVEQEIEPRYYMAGTTITEVSNDWGAGWPAGDVVPLSVLGVRRAADLTGDDLTQELDALIPDRFASLVELRLAEFLAQRDEGRDPEEAAAYRALWASEMEVFLAFALGITGAQLAAPVPAPTDASKA